jgi:hypothetical protein
MKKLYSLTFTLFTVFALQAQNRGDHFLSFGLSNDQFHYRTTYEQHAFSSNSSYTSRQSLVERNTAIGFQLGYTYHLSDRWQFSLRNNYSGDQHLAQEGIFDTLDMNDLFIELPREHIRKYRTNWTEALAFWSLNRKHSRLNVQLGIGVSYLVYWNSYRAGFSYNLDFGQYHFEQYKIEKGNSWGIPLQFQMQYPIFRRFWLGLILRANPSFEGHGQTSATVFCAYRL